MARNLVREQLLMDGLRALSDGELLSMLGAGDAARRPVPELAWLSVAELRRLGIGEARLRSMRSRGRRIAPSERFGRGARA